jgi:hypothetical protein
MVNKIDMDIASLSTQGDSVLYEKIELEMEQGYALSVDEVKTGVATGNFGDSDWVSLRMGEEITFFSGIEYTSMMKIIAGVEAPFNLEVARIQKTSKTGNAYKTVVGVVVEVVA